MRIAMALLSVALIVGCGGKKKKEGDGSGSAGSGSAMVGSGSDSGSGSGSAAAGSGSAAAGSGSGAGSGSAAPEMAHKGGNCPSTVWSSTTKAEVKDGKILLTITSDDKDAIVAIQKRTEALLKEKADGAGGGAAHDQKGSQGGGMGMCPVYFGEGGKGEAKNEDKGVTITITPKDKPEALKTEIDGRITKAADWVKANLKEGDKGTMGGVGGGGGEDGMNHSGQGDGKGQERDKSGAGSGSGSAEAPKGDGKGGGKGTGGGGGAGTGGGGGSGSNKK